jgi:hypothetical protein
MGSQMGSQMGGQMGTHHQPYGRDRPMFDDARRYEETYGSQPSGHNYSYGSHGGYASGHYGSGKYGGHTGYGTSPGQQTYESQHAGSQGVAPGFGGREHTGGGPPGMFGAAGYGRSSVAAASSHNDHGNPQQGQTGYGGMPDMFGGGTRGQQQYQHPGYGAGQHQAGGHQIGNSQQAGGTSGAHANANGIDDPAIRSYTTDPGKTGNTIVAGGPSPGPGHQQQRPGSAANGGVSGMPGLMHGQGGSHGFGGGYPGSVSAAGGGHQYASTAAGVGYGSLAGAHGGSSGTTSGLGSYYNNASSAGPGAGTGAGNAGTSNSNTRGGWGANYGGH